MQGKVQLEVNPTYRCSGGTRPLEILPWLREVNEISVIDNSEIPALSIVVNKRVVAVVDPFDDVELDSRWDEGGSTRQRIQELRPLIVFKYQWHRGVEYPPGTVSAGYPCARDLPCPDDLLTRKRHIAVTARMRVNHDYHWGSDTEWMKERSCIVGQTTLLSQLGHDARAGLTSAAEYTAELWDSQIGFEWRGSGYLTHRLIEYIRAGVVPITRPLGKEWPIREDVVLEDGVHCVFCSDPFRFAQEASRLLLEPQKIAHMRRNLLALWEEKLCPKAQGYWLWSKIKEATDVSV
ncbi:MAG TPA: hypothetical protein VGQ41_09015 [Pyrinomonadaceae bacterium]|jgi:hypothetical protein|nr:hypothetical protein [Pyrinomonadaceae bacterium]